MEVFRDGNDVVALIVNQGKTGRLIYVTPDCKVTSTVEIKRSENSESYQYISANLCHGKAEYRKLARAVRKDSFNQFGFRCSEQGGRTTGNDGDSGGCQCRSGGHINPWSDSCYKERAKPAVTAIDRLDQYVRSKGSLLTPTAKSQQPYVEKFCAEYSKHLAPTGEAFKPPPPDTGTGVQ
jgi:hypothetical protein